MASGNRINVWIDCDPGHDDAVAILLALHLPNIRLLGLSSVHGNASQAHTQLNAARILCSFGSPEQAAATPVVPGADAPLVRPALYAPAIHGEDGLGGVEGLLSENDEPVRRKLEEGKGKNVVLAIKEACEQLADGEKLALVATGTLTNVALFLSVFPALALEKVEQIVFMGGAEGRGNYSPVAEFNILCDPEAAQVVLNAPIPKVMMPLNITHTAIFDEATHRQLLKPGSSNAEGSPLPKAVSPLRHTLSTLFMFFAEAYKERFAPEFQDGPPVHDPLCIAYLAQPELFQTKRYRVDCETGGVLTAGCTVVDLYSMQDANLTAMSDPKSPESWGRKGKNVLVAQKVDVGKFWQTVLGCVDAADKVCPLTNRKE